MLANGFHESLSTESDRLLQTDISRRGTHLHYILAGLDVPAALTVMGVEAELILEETDADCLALARLEGDTLEALQLDGAQRLIVGCGRQIDLCNLVGSHLTRVLDLERQLYTIVRDLCLQVAVFKGGIGQAVAERPLDACVLLS